MNSYDIYQSVSCNDLEWLLVLVSRSSTVQRWIFQNWFILCCLLQNIKFHT